jgi:hypothetical protein
LPNYAQRLKRECLRILSLALKDAPVTGNHQPLTVGDFIVKIRYTPFTHLFPI